MENQIKLVYLKNMQFQCEIYQGFDCARFSQVTTNNARWWPTSGNQYGRRQTGSSCISGTGRDINEVLTATPTFSTTPYSMESLSTLPDVSRLPEINMAAVKPEVVLSLEREEISTKF